MKNKKLLQAVTILLCGIMLGGCTSVPYQFGKKINYIPSPPLAPDEPQFVYGRPNAFLDASDWIWPGSLFGKLILWNYKVDSHQISPETVGYLRAYLEANELDSVKVRVNSYSVGDEWRRTMRNKSIGAGWRYTLGFWSWLMYTIMPGRFFGGDNYNPYSNTINLYSDIPAVALHEGGHGQDFARRSWKGSYAALYAFIPFFNLYPEAIATTEALSYLNAIDDQLQRKNAYKILYPAYATYLGGNTGDWLLAPWNYIISLGAVIPGHILGRIKAAGIAIPPKEQPEPEN
jgi:hypothetical protein